MNKVLLLTGTIQSSKEVFKSVISKDIRLNQYVRNIRMWCNCSHGFLVVFVENSGFDEDEFRRLVGETKNEFIMVTLNNQSSSVSKGKGLGEMESIKTALDVLNLDDDVPIIKCNGRYYFNGINRFDLTDSQCVFINTRDSLEFSDSRVFSFTPLFFKEHLFPKRKIIDDAKGVYFEHALAMATLESKLYGTFCVRRIPFPLVVRGQSGSTGAAFYSPVAILKIYLKFYARKIASFNE